MTAKIKSLLLLVPALFLASGAQAQNKCSFTTTRGTYGATCSGSVFPGPGSFVPGSPLVPYALLGTCTGNSTGYFTCSGSASIGGVVIPAPAQGQSVVNPDCTGQITYNKGTPQELDINFLILHEGKQIRGMLQNPGTAVQCELVLMNRSGESGD